jgi:hypothetical protein
MILPLAATGDFQRPGGRDLRGRPRDDARHHLRLLRRHARDDVDADHQGRNAHGRGRDRERVDPRQVRLQPEQVLDKAAAESDSGRSILGPGTYLATPALVISTGLTIFIGTAGLPHILMRFFTVPDSKAARTSVVWTISLIAIFTALVTVMGFGARGILGRAGEEAVGPGGNLAAPLTAEALGGGDGTTGGDIAVALFSAAAFATILAAVAGLVIAASGAIAHDLWASFAKGVDEHSERTVARLAAVGGRRRRDRRHPAHRHGVQRDRARERGLRVRGERKLPAPDPRLDLAALQHRGRPRGRDGGDHRLGGPQPAGPAPTRRARRRR